MGAPLFVYQLLLVALGLCLSGLGGLGQSPGQGPSPWRSLAATAVHRLARLVARDPRDALIWDTYLRRAHRAPARVLGRGTGHPRHGAGVRSAPATGLPWLAEAAEPLRAFSRHVLHDVRGRQVQLDALVALRSAVKDGEGSAPEAIARLERSPPWVWVAMDPEQKRLLAVDAGNRTLVMAQRVGHHVAQVLAPDCAPLWLTDGCRASLTAWLPHYGHWRQPERRQAHGPAPQPRWRPLPQLRYAQVVKTVRRQRLVRVRHRVVLGTLETVNAVWAPLGCQSNTAFLERLHLSMRQHGAAGGRRLTTRCQDEAGL